MEALLSFFHFSEYRAREPQRNLHFLFFQKPPAVFYLSCSPENPLRKKKCFWTDIFLAVFQGLFIQNPKNIVSFPFILYFSFIFKKGGKLPPLSSSTVIRLVVLFDCLCLLDSVRKLAAKLLCNGFDILSSALIQPLVYIGIPLVEASLTGWQICIPERIQTR